jgi:hypothetical protein
LNPGRRGGEPATNRLSYGAAQIPFAFGHWVLTPLRNEPLITILHIT